MPLITSSASPPQPRSTAAGVAPFFTVAREQRMTARRGYAGGDVRNGRAAQDASEIRLRGGKDGSKVRRSQLRMAARRSLGGWRMTARRTRAGGRHRGEVGCPRDGSEVSPSGQATAARCARAWRRGVTSTGTGRAGTTRPLGQTGARNAQSTFMSCLALQVSLWTGTQSLFISRA